MSHWTYFEIHTFQNFKSKDSAGNLAPSAKPINMSKLVRPTFFKRKKKSNIIDKRQREREHTPDACNETEKAD